MYNQIAGAQILSTVMSNKLNCSIDANFIIAQNLARF